MIALGVALTQTEGIVLVVGYLFAGVGVIVLLIMPFRVWGTSASCPLCGTRVVMVGYNSSCVRCTKCDEYLEGRKKKARQMDIQYVSEKPAFKCRYLGEIYAQQLRPLSRSMLKSISATKSSQRRDRSVWSLRFGLPAAASVAVQCRMKKPSRRFSRGDLTR